MSNDKCQMTPGIQGHGKAVPEIRHPPSVKLWRAGSTFVEAMEDRVALKI